MIDEENYISHCAVSNKKGETVSKELINTLGETKSKTSLKIIASDGEPGTYKHNFLFDF